jgi:hypothetical protein
VRPFHFIPLPNIPLPLRDWHQPAKMHPRIDRPFYRRFFFTEGKEGNEGIGISHTRFLLEDEADQLLRSQRFRMGDAGAPS